MNDYKIGEIVSITIREARVTNSYPQTLRDRDMSVLNRSTVLVVDYLGGTERSLAVNVDAPNVSVEKVAPAEWPPRIGDVWTDRNGRPWFAIDATDENNEGLLELHGISTYVYGSTSPEHVNRQYGPMTLVQRFDPAVMEDEAPF